MSTTTEIPKKHITQLTAESKQFWQPLFTHMGLEKFQFGAKIGYLGREFEIDGLGRVECVRFFKNELENGDYYFEMYTFSDAFYIDGTRSLYRLRQNSNWESEPLKYKKVENPKFLTYAVKMTDFELVNETSVKALFPEIIKSTPISTPSITKIFRASDAGPIESKVVTSLFDAAQAEQDEVDVFTFEEKEDSNSNQMTMRDYYCMLQNVPLSNKKWLNTLIKEGQACQKK